MGRRRRRILKEKLVTLNYSRWGLGYGVGSDETTGFCPDPPLYWALHI